MPFMKIAILFLAIIINAALLAEARAHDCFPRTLEKTVEDSSSIYLGKVLTTEDAIIATKTSAGVTATLRDQVTLKFEVSKVFKGPKITNASIKVDGRSSVLYRPGASFLIYASTCGDSLCAGACSNSKRIVDAEQDLEYLKGLTNDTNGQKTAK